MTLGNHAEAIAFEMTEGMLHLRPTTTLGNIVQDALRKIEGLSIVLRSEETQIEVNPRVNTNILAEASNLIGRVRLCVEAPEHTEDVAFREVMQSLGEEIESFTSHSWDDENLPLFLNKLLNTNQED